MEHVTRRDILGTSALLASGLALGLANTASAQNAPPADAATGPYMLPPLPYDYADLEPHIDAQTMKLHHDVHHDAYVKGANKAIAELERVRRAGGDEIKHIRALTDSLAFNGAGHVLHTIFWNNMKKNGGGEPTAGSEIAGMITRDFGSFSAFQGHFNTAAVQVQGSGWALLCYDPLAQRLLVLQAEKHDNLAIWGTVPLLVLDVWEHAYYLKYQNRRPEYIKAFFNVINWSDVNDRLTVAKKLNS